MKLFINLMASAALLAALASCGGSAQKPAVDAAAEQAIVEEVEAPAVTVPAPKAGEVNVLPAGGTLASADLPIVIDFNATWCGPCQQFAPVFDAAAKANTTFYFYSVDIDKCPEMAEAYGVKAIPQVAVLFPDGTIKNYEPGFMEAPQFDELLKALTK